MASLAPVGTAAVRPAQSRIGIIAWALPAIFLIAIALRIWAASIPSIHHPDETFQYLEAAHRIVFGYGIVPWEYVWGIRNWLFPLLLAGPMALGGAIAPDSALYLMLPKTLMIAISLAIPWSGWRLGSRISPTHGLMAAFVCAIWSEFVYFAPHALSENLAIALTLLAATMLDGNDKQERRSAVLAAGILMSLATLVRFQFAPALAVIATHYCRTDLRRWGVLMAGGAVAATIGGLADIATGSLPFAWLSENVRQNVVEGRAALYGTLGPLGYVIWFELMWGWALAIVAPLAYFGIKRQPMLFWAGIANVAAHSLIAHKEYRFVELSAVAFIIVAAIGSIDAAALIRRRFSALSRAGVTMTLGICWLAASACVVTNWPMLVNLGRGSDGLAATKLIADDRATCGVGFVGDGLDWGGYVALHRRVAVNLFVPGDPMLNETTMRDAIRRWHPSFNRIVASEADKRYLPNGFALVGCSSGDAEHRRCVFARPGGCTDATPSPFRGQLIFDRVDAQYRDIIARRVPPKA